MLPDPIPPSTHPFYYPGGSTACLLLHGLTAVPQEMRWLGQHLHGQGYTVCGPLLAGHGAAPRDLARSRWGDWLLSAQAAYALLRHNCERVAVIGFSMGGALTLTLAPQIDAAALVLIATPFAIESAAAPLLPLLALIPGLTLRKSPPTAAVIARQEAIRAEQARRGEPVTGHVSFPVWPVKTLHELQKMLAQMQAGLPRVTAPALLLYSEDDDAAPPSHGEQIRARLGSTQIEMEHYPSRGHYVTEAPGYEEVYARISAFLGQMAPAGRP